ncbi:uncharacterized protein LOC117324810 [Pecten maximus]|uniref:uncharacterized protein LOC117324810 n=1 Tax=Pecten maximus TaxID=6579 RepID=UPI001458CB03|nr:uncharacterized protein LOC117324810 [Pecten maximus]
MGDGDLNELENVTSNLGSLKCNRLKKTMKDKCLVIGETTMYYGNFGSVQVLSPIPGSPNPGIEAKNTYICPDSPKETMMPPQTEQKVLSKKGKKSSSQWKNSKTEEKKNASYALPPLKAAPGNVSNSQFSTRTKGRKPCHFQRSKYTYNRETDYSIGPGQAWIPQPGFKPSGKKTTPKNTLITESSSLKYGSLLKLIESSKWVQDSPSLDTTSTDSIELPAIRGAPKTSDSSHTFTPTVQFINIYKESDQLPAPEGQRNANCQQKRT